MRQFFLFYDALRVRMWTVRLCAVTVAWTMSFPAASSASPFRNGSFEPTATQTIVWSHSTEGWVNVGNGAAEQVIDGWTVDSAVSWHSDVNAFSNRAELYYAADGGHWFVDLKGDPNDFALGQIHQTFDTVMGQQYEVTFFMAAPNMQFANPRVVDAWIDASTVRHFQMPAGSHQNLAWNKVSFAFMATATSSTLTLRAGATSAGGGQYWGALVDGVAVRAVPEPSGWIGALTFACLAISRRHIGRENHS